MSSAMAFAKSLFSLVSDASFETISRPFRLLFDWFSIGFRHLFDAFSLCVREKFDTKSRSFRSLFCCHLPSLLRTKNRLSNLGTMKLKVRPCRLPPQYALSARCIHF